MNPEDADITKLIDSAVEGMTAKLDPHTVVLPAKAFKKLTLDTKGQIGGVGIVVSMHDKRLRIISTIEGGPAARAGIKDGDEIVAIDGISLEKLGTESLSVMQGEPGSKLHLTVRRKNVEKPLEFSLRREIIRLSSVKTAALANGIHLVRVASFQENTARELQNFLQKHASKLRGLILDLRDNPGGLLKQAVRTVDLLLPSGLIVSTVGRKRDQIEREFAHKHGSYTGFPVIVLINGGTASAAEIVAGALQDHERALVLGTTSFGKGSVQTLIALPNGSGLKLTVATYYTPKDRSIQAKGIKPDIVVLEDNRPIKSQAKKESDLAGHIKSSDLSDFAQQGGILNQIRSWPDNIRNDRQIVTAFTYLRGWSIFQRP